MGDIKENISNNIVFYRKKAGLTQSQLAEKLGVKTTTVSTWERGASSPDIETLYDICKIFSVSLDEMYGVTAENSPDKKIPDGHSSYEPTIADVEKLLARNGRDLPLEQKMRLIKLLSELD